jgi:hypothetical protein
VNIAPVTLFIPSLFDASDRIGDKRGGGTGGAEVHRHRLHYETIGRQEKSLQNRNISRCTFFSSVRATLGTSAETMRSVPWRHLHKYDLV